MTVRRLFPYAYLAFVPAIFSTVSIEAKLLAALLVSLVALLIGTKTALSIVRIMLISAVTLIPFIIVVQWATCSSLGDSVIAACITDRSLAVVARILLASAVLLAAAANEWRGYLSDTVNALNLPRTIRTMLALSGVMIGEFRKAMAKVHHAFTARGEASPTFSFRNLVVLPRMLAVAWGSVLQGASVRLNLMWASDTFWERAIPHDVRSIVPGTGWRDALVLAAALLVLLLPAVSYWRP